MVRVGEINIGPKHNSLNDWLGRSDSIHIGSQRLNWAMGEGFWSHISSIGCNTLQLKTPLPNIALYIQLPKIYFTMTKNQLMTIIYSVWSLYHISLDPCCVDPLHLCTRIDVLGHCYTVHSTCCCRRSTVLRRWLHQQPLVLAAPSSKNVY